jgi:hypothetical protein
MKKGYVVIGHAILGTKKGPQHDAEQRNNPASSTGISINPHSTMTRMGSLGPNGSGLIQPGACPDKGPGRKTKPSAGTRCLRIHTLFCLKSKKPSASIHIPAGVIRLAESKR